ncbi:MAG: CHAT domain-containing protein [Rubrivivax sp.]|nr:CHAT domain-containing protein [Pyrinomonadaceae bacterium]
MRRKLPTLCLSLLLVGWWSQAPHRAAGHGQGQASRQSAELEEASRLNEQALKLSREGKYAEALPLAERILVIRQTNLGHTHPDVATSLNNIASLFRALGDYARAETLFRSTLALRETNLGPEHPDVGRSLNDLGLLYLEKSDYTRAEPLLERALAILEKALGPGHQDVTNSVYNLASLYRVKGDHGRAEPLYRRALIITEKALDPANPIVSYPLIGLALLYQNQGDYTRAEPLLERALAVLEKALGAEHPRVVNALKLLAELYEAQGEMSQAIEIRSRSQETRERLLSRTLATGSERLKLSYLATLSGETAATVSLHIRSAPAAPLALQLALTTILRRKGRALDAMSDQVASLRRSLDPQDRALLGQLSAAQSRLATLTLSEPVKPPPAEPTPDVTTIRPKAAPGGRPSRPRRPEPPSAASRIQAEIERLQEAVSRRSAEISAQTPPVTIELVRQAIPDGAALVEFFSYRPLDAKAKTRAEKFGPARYVAYVLRKESAPRWADLGEAAVVDASMARLLASLKCPQTVRDINQCPTISEVRRLARDVDERVMRPIRPLTGDARHLFISPDGALNLLPFAALVDEKDKYLVESYALTYLTSGRDLLRLQQSAESRQPPLVIADPDFGPNIPAGRGLANGTEAAPVRRSTDMVQVHFNPLTGTRAEAKALFAVMPDVQLLTQGQATEAALKQVSAPRVLHIATHGFFLSDQPAEATDGTRGLSLVIGDEGGSRALARSENPLLRSGLALAGANLGQGAGGEDGTLTALEASALDLWGTKLVVLSACETGIGEVRNGEGVYGLRRALVLAGSESQVMSLWQVSDDATRDLMIRYYKRLMTGEGRTEALRRVQIGMLGGGKVEAGGQQRGIGVQGSGADRRHPYFWAAFIQSGDWRSMQTQPASAK